MAIDKVKIEEMTEMFADELKELKKQIEEAEEIYKILKEEAIMLKDNKQRGTFKYTVDTFQNLINMSGQHQSLLKDKTNIKKIIIDLAMKDKNNEEDGIELKDVLLSIMEENRVKKNSRDKNISKVKDHIETITKNKDE